MEWLVGVTCCAALAAALLAWQRGRAAESELIELRRELAVIHSTQQELQLDLQRGREDSLRELGNATRGLHADLARAQESLAEVRALEGAGSREMERAARSLRRLEAVVAGSASRGGAGESVLARALAHLPADLLECDVPFGSRVVEYALRLPDGRLLPIDSKWTSAEPLSRLDEEEDPAQRQVLTDAVVRDVRQRLKELARYADPDRTLPLAVLAVPDAVFFAAPQVQAEGFEAGVVVVPYSLALGQLLAIYRLALQSGTSLDAEPLAAALRQVERSLRRCEEEVEGRLSRALVQAGNARDALRQHQAEALRALARVADPKPAGPEPVPEQRLTGLPRPS
jgi:DNA recombination protein RmuC